MVKLVMNTESGRVIQECDNLKEAYKVIREENAAGFYIRTGSF